MNGLLVAGTGATAILGALVWGVGSVRAKVRADRRLRETMTPAESAGLLRAHVARRLAKQQAHIEIHRVAICADDGVIYAARHYATVAGPETETSFMASREARRLTDPRRALPCPTLPIHTSTPRERVTSDTLPRRAIPWSTVVGHVDGLPDDPRDRTPAQLRAIHRESWEGARV